MWVGAVDVDGDIIGWLSSSLLLLLLLLAAASSLNGAARREHEDGLAEPRKENGWCGFVGHAGGGRGIGVAAAGLMGCAGGRMKEKEMVMASASTSRRRRARHWTPVPCLMLLWWYGVCVSGWLCGGAVES